MKKAVAIFCVCAVGLLITCAKSNNPTGPGGNTTTMIMTYTSLSNNAIIVSRPQSITPYTYCSGNSLVTGYDTSDASIDTMDFVLSSGNDSLKVSGGGSGSMAFIRVGTGSGIQGQWTGSMGSLAIGPNTITVTETASPSTDADNFVDEWNSYPLADNVTVTRTSSNSVNLTGNATHEVVTITFNGTSETYSSSIAAHVAGTYYYNPTACPNPMNPAWYDDFLAANSSTAKKAMSKQPVPSNGFFGVLINKRHHQ